MEAVQQPLRVTCPNCGAQDTGTYCSTCGAELHATPRHPFRVFLDTFLKLGDIKAYLVQYATLARAPVRHTIRAFEEDHLHGALRFAKWSRGLYIGFTLPMITLGQWVQSISPQPGTLLIHAGYDGGYAHRFRNNETPQPRRCFRWDGLAHESVQPHRFSIITRPR